MMHTLERSYYINDNIKQFAYSYVMSIIGEFVLLGKSFSLLVW